MQKDNAPKYNMEMGVTTTYEYDEKTFRLTRLRSTRNNGADILQDFTIPL